MTGTSVPYGATLCTGPTTAGTTPAVSCAGNNLIINRFRTAINGVFPENLSVSPTALSWTTTCLLALTATALRLEQRMRLTVDEFLNPELRLKRKLLHLGPLCTLRCLLGLLCFFCHLVCYLIPFYFFYKDTSFPSLYFKLKTLYFFV